MIMFLCMQMHFPNAKTVISKACGAQADILVEGGDKIEIGNLVLEVRQALGLLIIGQSCHSAITDCFIS